MTKAMRRKEQQELIKAVKYLEFFESLLDESYEAESRIREQFRNTTFPSMIQEAFSLDEQLNQLQKMADEKVLPEIAEILRDNELLSLATTPN